MNRHDDLDDATVEVQREKRRRDDALHDHAVEVLAGRKLSPGELLASRIIAAAARANVARDVTAPDADGGAARARQVAAAEAELARRDVRGAVRVVAQRAEPQPASPATPASPEDAPLEREPPDPPAPPPRRRRRR